MTFSLTPAPAIPELRERAVFACILAGEDYSTYHKNRLFDCYKPICKDTWYTYAGTIYNRIVTLAKEKEIEEMAKLKAANTSLVCCADGAWSHPSKAYNANQSCYLVMNSATNKIILVITLQRVVDIARARECIRATMMAPASQWRLVV
jgi:hypothetical protein